MKTLISAKPTENEQGKNEWQLLARDPYEADNEVRIDGYDNRGYIHWSRMKQHGMVENKMPIKEFFKRYTCDYWHSHDYRHSLRSTNDWNQCGYKQLTEATFNKRYMETYFALTNAGLNPAEASQQHLDIIKDVMSNGVKHMRDLS